MNSYYLNKLLKREEIKNDIKNKLLEFEKKKQDPSITRGFYLYGYSGIGKTEFIKDILNELNYDIIYYDSGDIRNKKAIEKITNQNMSDRNVLSLLHKKKKHIAIVMDELDSMNSGDKSGITSLIKLSRGKKTKKQRKEQLAMTPIICIGNYHMDKKIKELMKVSNTYELKKPSYEEMYLLIKKIMPCLNDNLQKKMIEFIDGDLRKLNSFYSIYLNSSNNIDNYQNLFEIKINNEFSKDLINTLLERKFNIQEHNLFINETDRTTVSLLLHENIIDNLEKHFNEREKIKLYCEVLNNYIYCDYIDRITFQKQIWIFNELTSVLKTINTNNIYHTNLNRKVNKIKKETVNQTNNEIRFTKILTKYSTEYNNSVFLNELCYKLNMDKKDVISYFFYLKNNKSNGEILELLNDYDITKLDLNRIYKLINLYT